jgi:uncharacterized protein YegL
VGLGCTRGRRRATTSVDGGNGDGDAQMMDVGEAQGWRAARDRGLLPVVLIVDTSGSMDEHGKLRVAQACIRELIEELSSEAWSDNVRVGLVGMGPGPAVVVPLDTPGNFKVPSLVASGHTRLGAAIEETASMLSRLDPSTSAHGPLVLLLSDGGWEDAWSPAMASSLGGVGRDSIRVCVAIGADADRSAMAAFSDEVVTVDTLPPLVSYLAATAGVASGPSPADSSPTEGPFAGLPPSSDY